jgi:hypothetical protein
MIGEIPSPNSFFCVSFFVPIRIWRQPASALPHDPELLDHQAKGQRPKTPAVHR